MMASEAIGAGLLLLGTAFFVAGTVGLLRFPDVHSRLHALTKADNVGLGLVAAGLGVWAASAAVVLKLILIWLLALCASAVSSYLIASSAPRFPLLAPAEDGHDR
jgi:multicomponent Na+:H+ antiporter subunit G